LLFITQIEHLYTFYHRIVSLQLMMEMLMEKRLWCPDVHCKMCVCVCVCVCACVFVFVCACIGRGCWYLEMRLLARIESGVCICVCMCVCAFHFRCFTVTLCVCAFFVCMYLC